MASHRVGNRLTAGRDVLDIALTYDADAISDAISPLMTNQGTTPPEWIPVKLGDTTFEIDRTLQGDLLGALLGWKIDVELGDLLDQYPAD